MKNFLLLFSAVVMSLVACDRFEMEDVKTYRAVVETFDATRTSLGEGNKIVWSSEDLISVFENNENASRYQVVSSSAGNPEASFVLMEEGKNGAEIGADIAVYPFSQSLECSRLSTGDYRVSGLSIPSVQSYSPEGFASGIFPMIAVSEAGTGELSFRNACGILNLSLTGTASVSSITVKGNAGELLSGSFSVTSGIGGVPAVTMESDASQEVSLDCGQSGVQLDPDVPASFMLVLPPVAFSEGFTATVTAADGAKVVLSTAKANPVRRSSILKMPVVSLELPDPGEQKQTTISVTGLKFNDVTIKVEVADAVQYSGGCVLKEDFNVTTVLRAANWKTAPRITDTFVYEGSMTAFPSGGSAKVIPGRTYVVWVAPYAEGVKTVKEEDLVCMDVTVPSVVDGGSCSVVVDDFRTDFKSAEADVRSEGAEMIYAAFYIESDVASLTSDQAAITHLLDNAVPVYGASCTASISGLEPGTELTLLALAVDAQGRYGKLVRESHNVDIPIFNDEISISIDVSQEGKTAYVKLDSEGADVVRYHYYVGKTSGSEWARLMGGTREGAEEYMAINSDYYLIGNTEEEPLTDGCIVVNDLEIGSEYVAVVMAIDSDGLLSRVHTAIFTPRLDMGNFVRKTGSTQQQWLASKPEVTFGTCTKDGEFHQINWSVSSLSGFTVYSACLSPLMISDDATPEDIVTIIYNHGEEAVNGKMLSNYYASEDSVVYVTWCDADGNFYESFMVDVP